MELNCFRGNGISLSFRRQLGIDEFLITIFDYINEFIEPLQRRTYIRSILSMHLFPRTTA